MKWRITNPEPELVDQIPVNEEFGIRIFRYRFKRVDETSVVDDASILAAAKEFLQIESPRGAEIPASEKDKKDGQASNHEDK